MAVERRQAVYLAIRFLGLQSVSEREKGEDHVRFWSGAHRSVLGDETDLRASSSVHLRVWQGAAQARAAADDVRPAADRHARRAELRRL